jgi:hypothetical protein
LTEVPRSTRWVRQMKVAVAEFGGAAQWRRRLEAKTFSHCKHEVVYGRQVVFSGWHSGGEIDDPNQDRTIINHFAQSFSPAIAIDDHNEKCVAYAILCLRCPTSNPRRARAHGRHRERSDLCRCSSIGTLREAASVGVMLVAACSGSGSAPAGACSFHETRQ